MKSLLLLLLSLCWLNSAQALEIEGHKLSDTIFGNYVAEDGECDKRLNDSDVKVRYSKISVVAGGPVTLLITKEVTVAKSDKTEIEHRVSFPYIPAFNVYERGTSITTDGLSINYNDGHGNIKQLSISKDGQKLRYYLGSWYPGEEKPTEWICNMVKVN